MDFSEQLEQLKKLAGIYTPYVPKDEVQKNISHAGTEKSKFMKKHKIEPGTEEWFRLWFSKPYLTHENPFGKSR